MKNFKLVNEILSTLEKEHLNLYHSISRENVQKFINKVDWNNLNDLQFDYEMLKLFALFKDAHTSYFVPNIPLDKKIIYLQNKLYVLEKDKYLQVIKIANKDIKPIINKIKKMTTYETKEWANCQVNFALRNFYWYKILELTNKNKIEFLTKNNKEIIIKQQKNITSKSPDYYSYEIKNDILYLRYGGCADIPNYPFVEMVKDIKSEIKAKKIKKYILDVRGNKGGNSEILNPFQELVKKQKLQGVLLIDNYTFSSGRFAVGRFKKHFNTPLLGESTGGSAQSYGARKRLTIHNKNFSASTKYFDFSDLGYKNAFLPDIEIKTTIKDLQKQNDPMLKKAIEYLRQI